eukprot:10863729-Karenia_brevis.AAC.1
MVNRREDAEQDTRMANDPVASANVSAAQRVLSTSRRPSRLGPGPGEFSTDSTSPMSAASPSEVVLMTRRPVSST